MNNRRKLLAALGASALAAPFASFAQAQGKVRRIGILANIGAADKWIDGFTQGLKELGYVEGSNIQIERRFAEGNLDRLDKLAEDLVRQKPEVIFAPNTPSVQAAKKYAGAIPIVFATLGDPVGAGFVASFARPGGTITGTSNLVLELSAKRLQVLKDAVPRITRVAVLDTDDRTHRNAEFAEIQRAAKALGVEVLRTQVLQRSDMETVSAQLRKWRADSICVVSSPTNTYNRKLLVEFATKLRLPAVYYDKDFAEAGGLISYGPSVEALYHRAAYFVDKILKGAKPADLPVEQPTKFELVVNLNTARALGIKFPNTILLNADRAIEP
ncbi:MAG: ABC transporter substrate-binding protein [Betaproteobacteria bacterium]|nr:ABC transporter substrate-binding protein [Betaproteobacteria bacterium]